MFTKQLKGQTVKVKLQKNEKHFFKFCLHIYALCLQKKFYAKNKRFYFKIKFILLTTDI